MSKVKNADIREICKQKARKILHELDDDFKIDIDEFDIKLEVYLTEELFSLAVYIRESE